MRKRVRIPKPVSVPMLINRGLRNADLELRERMFVEAMAGGWATTEHFDNLADMRDCLLLAAAHKDDQPIIDMCKAVGITLRNIRDRYQRCQRMGAAADELTTLRLFIDVYRDFWLRQPVSFYESACEALGRARSMGSTACAVEVAR